MSPGSIRPKLAAILHAVADSLRSSPIVQAPNSAISEAGLRAALDGIVRESLRPVAIGLGMLYLVFAVGHGLVLPKAIAAPMSLVAAGTAALFLSLYLTLGRWSVPGRWAHPIVAAMAGLVLLNSLLHLALLSEPQQTTNLMLLAIGVGCVFLSTGWLVVALGATLGGWGLVVWGAAPFPLWLHFGFGLLSASVLSVLIHTIRVRTFRRLERDMRERTRAEEAVRRSEEYFRALTENALDVITILNGDGTVRYVGPSAGRVLGYPPQDSLGKEGFGFVHPDDVPGLMTAFAEALQKPGVALHCSAFRLRHRDGSWRVFECVGKNLLDNPAVAGLVVNSRDITERAQAEAALRHAYQELERRVEERTAELAEVNTRLRQQIAEHQQAQAELLRLSTAVRMSTDSIVICDLAGKIIDANEATLKMYGTTDKGDLQGKSAFELIVPEDRAKAFAGMEETLEQGFLRNRQYQIILKDGRTIPVEMSVALMKDAGGKVVGFVGISRDITERKHMEDELLQAKEAAETANHAKSEFLATMSHELRTPLHVVLGYSDLLLEETFGRLIDEQAQPLRRIRRNARELLDLITAVLDMSRLEAGRLPIEVQAVELPALLEELKVETQGVQEQSGLDFVWKAEGELPLLHTDVGKLKVVLKNLIGNAVKFTQEGCITIAVQGSPLGVEITVSDTGIGIPPEALGLIFEPFRQAESTSTRAHGGTGLGLHIVRRLLELLGGTVTVESEVGRGSTFRVWVPRERPGSSEIASAVL